MTVNDFSNHSALVTGATSGLGFEAAAQIADQGYRSVTITGRTAAKAETARAALVERTGRDVFATAAVDVADLASSRAAADELVGRGGRFDAVILNAGMVPNGLKRTADGIELTFAASIIGHHILTEALVRGGLVEGGLVAIVGSEAANNDLPKMMRMSIYDFATGSPSDFGTTAPEAMRAFATGTPDVPFNAERQYSTVKVFSAWWSAAMARRYAGTTFITVSPGANLNTDVTRNLSGGSKILFGLMARFGRYIGMDQPVADGAKRYLDVAHNVGGQYENGRTYTSRPKKMVGPLVLRDETHLLDTKLQDAALELIDELTGVRV